MLLLHWQFGIDRLAWESNDLATLGVVLAMCWLITWRAWPALEITRAFLISPEAGLAYRPTWPHVLGALGLGLVWPVATAIPLLLADRASDVDFGARTRGGLLLALICYIVWPALVIKWRQVRI